MRLLMGGFLALLASTSAHAVSVPYSTANATFTNLGGSLPGDTLTLGTDSGIFTGPGTYGVNNVSFTAGRFPVTPTPFTGTFADSFTTSSGIVPFAVNYSLQLGNADTITLGGNSFDISGFHVLFNPLTLTSGVGETATDVLTATVTEIGAVPEPATWAMMLVGFGATGLSLRSKRRSVFRKMRVA